jgi:hypothetical protein
LAASLPSALRWTGRRAPLALPLLAACLSAADAAAQEAVEPVLRGKVMLADAPLTRGTVVLHHVSDVIQGEIDSIRVGTDGAFAIRLPGVPDPTSGDVYFASVRHQGVMYFGQALTEGVQLDSLYLIQAYDTLLAPAEGVPVALSSRSIFFEADGPTWRITDVFQLRNDGDRTVVARPGGRVWSYPLPGLATEVVTGEGEMSADVITYEDGGLVVRAALSPGERPFPFVVRYTLASPAVEIPTPGTTEIFDVLVREPAPPLDVAGLAPAEPIGLENGGTYRRYAGEDVTLPSVRVTLGEERRPPPVRWIAVVLALVLAAGGLVALRSTSARSSPVRPEPRQALLLQLARLDEDFERQRSGSKTVEQEYRRRRAELIGRLKSSS